MIEYTEIPFEKLARRLGPIMTKLKEKSPQSYVAQRFISILSSKTKKYLIKRNNSRRNMAQIPQGLLHRIAEAELYLSSF